MRHTLFKLIKKIKHFFVWIWRQEGTPAQRSVGIAVGVFSGCFPLFGFQTLFGIALARLFRANYLLAATGTWISNPFTYVPLYWFNYKVGLMLLGGENKLLNLTNLSQQEMWRQGWLISSRILFGSFAVGTFFGLLLGYVSYIFFKFSRKSKH